MWQARSVRTSIVLRFQGEEGGGEIFTVDLFYLNLRDDLFPCYQSLSKCMGGIVVAAGQVVIGRQRQSMSVGWGGRSSQ
jgi:hypothetical protein